MSLMVKMYIIPNLRKCNLNMKWRCNYKGRGGGYQNIDSFRLDHFAFMRHLATKSVTQEVSQEKWYEIPATHFSILYYATYRSYEQPNNIGIRVMVSPFLFSWKIVTLWIYVAIKVASSSQGQLLCILLATIMAFALCHWAKDWRAWKLIDSVTSLCCEEEDKHMGRWDMVSSSTTPLSWPSNILQVHSC